MPQPDSAFNTASPTSSSQNDVSNSLALQNTLASLEDGDFQTRWEAAKIIPSFGLEAIEPLLQLLGEDDDWELTWFIARILGGLDHPIATQSLVQLVRTAENPEVAGMAAMALVSHGTRAIDPLTELLHLPSTRLLAVQSLAQIHHPDVIVPLVQVISDPNPEIRAAAIEALSHFGSATVSTILLDALQDPVAFVRQTAVAAIGLQAAQLNNLDLVQQLRPLLWDVNLAVCRQTATALARIGTAEAISLLAEVLHSNAAEPIQIDAIRALGWIDTTAAIDQLRQVIEQQTAPIFAEDQATTRPEPFLLANRQTIGLEIVSVLGRVERAETIAQATQILLLLLETNHPIAQTIPGKQTIALSLGQLGQSEAIDPLIELLADPNQNVRLHTIAALKQIDAEFAYQQMVRLVYQETIEPVLREGITIALREWGYSAETAA
jgi:HEAT repeat protein